MPSKKSDLSLYSCTDRSSREHSSDKSALDLYFTFCNSQPLSLFARGVCPENIGRRDPELLLAMEALGLRFQGRVVKDCQIESEIQRKTKRSRQIIMSRLDDGTVELSSIQSLCLLSILEYTCEDAQVRNKCIFFLC